MKIFIKPDPFKLLAILLLILIIVGCKKHSDEVRDPFTNEQMGWINNLKNPKYRCITKSTNSQGNVIAIDTVVSETEYYYQKSSTIQNDEYSITYYWGYYRFWLGYINTEQNSVFYNLDIDADNINTFQAILRRNTDYIDINKYSSDTTLIDGVLYHDVFKIDNLTEYSPIAIKKIYFKKGIGYLYLEQFNGNNATIIQ